MAEADLNINISASRLPPLLRSYGATGRLGMPPMKFYYVYILTSIKFSDRHYIGITDDLKARLKKHNSGSCVHTSKYRPWKIETAIAFSSESKAVAFENYLKSGSGREFAIRHF